VSYVTIPDSVTTISDNAFAGCSNLTSVTFGDSVTTIGDNAFLDCISLTSATLGDSVTAIGDYAFRDCSSLTAVTIPTSVTFIGISAFPVSTALTYDTDAPTMTPTLKKNTQLPQNSATITVLLSIIAVLLFAALTFFCYKHWKSGHIMPLQYDNNELNNFPSRKARKIVKRDVSLPLELQ
jgi:hypothetical protein